MNGNDSLPKRKQNRLPGFDYRTSEYYFLTICTHNKKRMFANDENCQMFADVMLEYADKYEVGMVAWCIMPDHVHIICSPIGKRTVSDYVGAIKAVTSKRIGTNKSKPIWQRSYFDHILRSKESITEKSVYILINPERAGIVKRAKDYMWSGCVGTLKEEL
jgi:putative transposase